MLAGDGEDGWVITDMIPGVETYHSLYAILFSHSP